VGADDYLVRKIGKKKLEKDIMQWKKLEDMLEKLEETLLEIAKM
jgi:response regulator of citrate/malate metabolism